MILIKRKVLFRRKRRMFGLVLLLSLLEFTRVLPHFTPGFTPRYPRIDLIPILTAPPSNPRFTPEDYTLFRRQTGLSPTAIDELISSGSYGIDRILSIQESFYSDSVISSCSSLGIFTWEHRFRDENGSILYQIPLVPLKNGDILVTFSTHTLGWAHGHAALVVDSEQNIGLEAVFLGSLSQKTNLFHWKSYSTLLVLRPKTSDPELGEKVAEFALNTMNEVPYSLFSGLFGDKFQPEDAPHTAHCAYLPWYCWKRFGIDLDSGKNDLVSVENIAKSDQVEVLQVFGLDPDQYPLTFSS